MLIRIQSNIGSKTEGVSLSSHLTQPAPGTVLDRIRGTQSACPGWRRDDERPGGGSQVEVCSTTEKGQRAETEGRRNLILVVLWSDALKKKKKKGLGFVMCDRCLPRPSRVLKQLTERQTT